MNVADGARPAVLVLMTVLTVSQAAPQETTTEAFNVNPSDNSYASCLRDNKRGMCLRDYQCYANHTIAYGGDIIGNDIRDSSEPILNCGVGFWCCIGDSNTNPVVSPKPTPTPPPKPTSTVPKDAACSRVFDEECTWCVALYREGGDVSRRHRTETGLYCGGALLGGRVVLTAATCARTVLAEAVRARVPASLNPAKDYAVVDKILHPKYSTGTHANDLALMVLKENVQWDMGGNNGACVELRKPMEGNCLAIGFSIVEQLVTSPVSVSDGGCRKKGAHGGNEVACGTTTAGQCQAAVGAPVLCPVTSDGQGGMALAGVVRQHCLGDSVLLGKVQMHADWLNQELQRLGLESTFYNV